MLRVIRKISFCAYKLLLGDERLKKVFFSKLSNVENYIFLDFGGFEGEWTDSSIECGVKNVWIFEPDPTLYYNLVKKYENNNTVLVIGDIISKKNETVDFYSDGLSSSSLTESVHLDMINSNVSKVKKRQLTKKEIGILLQYDLLIKINIEGAEYELIDYLAEIGVLGRAERVAVQTHILKSKSIKNITSYFKLMYSLFSIKKLYPLIWDLWEKCTAHTSRTTELEVHQHAYAPDNKFFSVKK